MQQCYKNIYMIGTSHIATQSVREVKKLIQEIRPDMVAIELDARRAHALESKDQQKLGLGAIRHIGWTGYLFAKIGNWLQKKLGKIVGISPGTEMMAAKREATKIHAKVLFIDQDISITLKRLSKAMTLKEKARIPYDIIKSILFKKREMKRLGLEGFDLSTVPEEKIIKVLMNELHQKYPNVYKVLIEERNRVMAKRLTYLMMTHPGKRIVAVLGAGHVEEMHKLLIEYEEKAKKQQLTFSQSFVVSS